MFKNKLLVQNKLLVAFISCFFSVAAMATELSYTNVTVGYSSIEVIEEDFTGYGVSGSLQVGENIFIFGSTNDLTSDNNIAGKERDISVTALGGGVIIPVAETMDVNATISYVNQDGDDDVLLADGEGFTVGVGLRSLVGSNFEVGGGLTYVNIEEEDSTELGIYGRYFIRAAISLGASYGDSDDAEGYALDVRIDF